MRNRLRDLAVAVGGVLALAACQQDAATMNKDPFVRGNARIQGHYGRQDGKLERLTYDSNNDGKTDTWAYTSAAVIARIEIDADADGKVDRWEYYTPGQTLEKVGFSRGNTGTPDAWAFQGADGTISRMDIAGPCPRAPIDTLPAAAAAPLGAVVTRREFYAGGGVVRAQDDANCDGQVDKWETFQDGALTVVAFDTTGRGTPDWRIVYARDGSAHVEIDPAGTGQFRPAPHVERVAASPANTRR